MVPGSSMGKEFRVSRRLQMSTPGMMNLREVKDVYYLSYILHLGNRCGVRRRKRIIPIGSLSVVPRPRHPINPHWALATSLLYTATEPHLLHSLSGLVKAKGNGSKGNYSSFAVHIATCHKIPSAAFQDGWTAAIARLEASEDMPSESETKAKPSKVKAKNSKARRSGPLSEIEAESSDDSASDSDSEDVGIKRLINYKPSEDDQIGMLSHTGHKPLFDHHDSDIEEIPGFQVDPSNFEGTVSYEGSFVQNIICRARKKIGARERVFDAGAKESRLSEQQVMALTP
ncbi:hypothetical protein DFH09DRAFT_1082425 [Mycena vulgaris]|nr:hypothetical protein DFH09DRAFT_1082425 [Mycena vulgaris]